MKLNCAEPWPSRNWVETNALEVAEVEDQLVSAQTISHTLQKVGLHGLQGSLFWSWLTKNPANSLLKTTWPRAWITGTMSCGLMSLRYTCLTRMVSSMCGDALVRSTKNEESFKGLLHPQNENPKYIKLCSEDEWNFYGFGTTCHPLMTTFSFRGGINIYIFLKKVSEGTYEVTYRICALHLTHPKCTTQQWTHTRSSGQTFVLRHPGSSWGFGALLNGTSVMVLRVERALYIHSPHLQFLPAQDSYSQPFDYESDSLTIRPRRFNAWIKALCANCY